MTFACVYDSSYLYFLGRLKSQLSCGLRWKDNMWTKTRLVSSSNRIHCLFVNLRFYIIIKYIYNTIHTTFFLVEMRMWFLVTNIYMTIVAAGKSLSKKVYKPPPSRRAPLHKNIENWTHRFNNIWNHLWFWNASNSDIPYGVDPHRDFSKREQALQKFKRRCHKISYLYY